MNWGAEGLKVVHLHCLVDQHYEDAVQLRWAARAVHATRASAMNIELGLAAAPASSPVSTEVPGMGSMLGGGELDDLRRVDGEEGRVRNAFLAIGEGAHTN